MKKMLLATALALLITGCQQTFAVQNKPAVAPKKAICHHFFVSGIGLEENCRCSQNLWRREENVVKTETQQTFVNGLLGFITLDIYTPLEARVLSVVHELPIDMGSSIYCSLIYFWVPSSCFCIVISLSLRVK